MDESSLADPDNKTLLSRYIYQGDCTLPQIQSPDHADELKDPLSLPQELRSQFNRDGFVILPQLLSAELVLQLNVELESVLRGQYNRSSPPDKAPRRIKIEYKHDTDSQVQQQHQQQHKRSNAKPDERDCYSGLNDNSETKLNKDKRKKQGVAAGPLGFTGNTTNIKVLQVINIHKCNNLFRYIATHTIFGSLVAQLTRWNGVRLAQDQVWAKPPGAPALAFHRDAPYFMFADENGNENIDTATHNNSAKHAPSKIVTVWIALDDMDAELGPLQYARGSHLWTKYPHEATKQFFPTKIGNNSTTDGDVTRTNHQGLLYRAAKAEGITDNDLDVISLAGLPAGSVSIHHGDLWHGSDRNASKTRPRRGLGLHYCPANVKFTKEARHSSLWKRYVQNSPSDADAGTISNTNYALPDDDFPVVSIPE